MPKPRIKAKFRKENKDLIKKGDDLLTAFFGRIRFPYDQSSTDILMHHFDMENRDDLLMKLGAGKLELTDDLKILFKKDSRTTTN